LLDFYDWITNYNNYLQTCGAMVSRPIPATLSRTGRIAKIGGWEKWRRCPGGAVPRVAQPAQFMLKICSDAMDDFAKVTAVARDNPWVEATIIPREKITSRSSWFVNHGDQQFFASIWLNSGDDAKLPPLKACAMIFPNTVNRDEFFNFVSSSLDLEYVVDLRGPKIRFESYELKSFRPKKIVLSIISINNGTVTSAEMQERPIFAFPRRPVPDAPPDAAR
jgi:hypothetical protein